MVELSLVEALNYERSRITEILKHFDGFLINAMSIVVLGHSAIIGVGQTATDVSVVIQVINIDCVDVTSLLNRSVLTINRSL